MLSLGFKVLGFRALGFRVSALRFEGLGLGFRHLNPHRDNERSQ